MPAGEEKQFGREQFLATVARLILRWALAVTFISAVADRFGIWGAPETVKVSWGAWGHFVAYTTKVNSFLPEQLAPVLAVLATAAEAGAGCGPCSWCVPSSDRVGERSAANAFAVAMTVSFGIKAPLNYSVFVDAAATFALAFWLRTFKSKSNPVKIE